MPPIRCFLVEENGQVLVSLRRFTFSTGSLCEKAPYGGHEASVQIGEHPRVLDADGYLPMLETDHNDPRWPKTCMYCDYVFQIEDEWQTNQRQTYAPAPGNDGPEGVEWKWTQHELPAGAMFFPSWFQSTDETPNPLPGYLSPTEGSVLLVVCPAWADDTGTAEWIVDSYASNCDRKGEVHHCWCRHGQAPWITVDKNGDTCSAGAGSIWVNMSSGRGWHGFLRDGWLVKA